MSDIINQPSFEEKMMARIKESMGDLMTDEQLRGILDKGVEKAFFERRKDGTSYNARELPSLVDQCIEKYLKERMYAAVNEWIAANPDKVEAKVKEAIEAGVAKCCLQTLDNRFSGLFQGMLSQFHAQQNNS